MSKRSPEVSVLTANRLVDGIVVFLAPDGGWTETIDGAAVARSADEARALQEQGARDAARNVVVEPYLAALAEAGARPLPVRMRERVRVEGPSVLADVPGYVPPGSARSASARATPASPRAPIARGEGRGEGRQQMPTPALVAAPHPHPSPLPARAGGGESRTAPVEA
jgi:hypothetical protein